MKTHKEVLRMPELSALDLGVYIWMHTRASGGVLMLSDRGISAAAEVPRSTLQRVLKKLESLGAIERRPGSVAMASQDAEPTQNRPSSKQLALLAKLREERGVTGSEPKTKKEAWLEIKKLKASEPKKEEPRRQAPPPVEPPEEPGMISPEAFAAAFGEFLS